MTCQKLHGATFSAVKWGIKWVCGYDFKVCLTTGYFAQELANYIVGAPPLKRIKLQYLAPRHFIEGSSSTCNTIAHFLFLFLFCIHFQSKCLRDSRFYFLCIFYLSVYLQLLRLRILAM